MPLIVRLEIRLDGPLGDTMSAVRTWLDANKVEPTIFKPTEGGFEIAFRNEHDAGRFKAEFAGGG